MKRKLSIVSALLLALIATLYVTKSSNSKSDLIFANVEALANGEGGGSSLKWPCWSKSDNSGDGYFWFCGNPCVVKNGKASGGKSQCVSN